MCFIFYIFFHSLRDPTKIQRKNASLPSCFHVIASLLLWFCFDVIASLLLSFILSCISSLMIGFHKTVKENIHHLPSLLVTATPLMHCTLKIYKIKSYLIYVINIFYLYLIYYIMHDQLSLTSSIGFLWRKGNLIFSLIKIIIFYSFFRIIN